MAAAITAGQVSIDDASDMFGNVRDAIHAGTVRLAQETEIGEVVGRPSGKSFGGGGQKKDPGTVAFKSGKHAGKTIAQVNESDADYLVWVAENSKNDFMRRVTAEFLAGAAA